jgi:hypothetical protein
VVVLAAFGGVVAGVGTRLTVVPDPVRALR